MHWQFGGNLEPVQMICELNWKECPKAIANYIWSEIVTDVLDYLKNDDMVWRILAVFFVCIVLLRTVYSRTKQFNDSAVSKEMMNKIGYKVEDLELKVNILTYKMQYGSWPLPHQVQKSNFRKHLRDLRLTLSNPNDRNDWIKRVLLSPRRNESYVSCSKYNYPSEYRLTELFDAKKKNVYPYLRQESLPIENSSKSSKSSSDKSLKLNSIFKKAINRKHRETLKNETFEMQQRNAISLPLFSRNKSNKSRQNFKGEKLTGACKKFTKTIDECKRYLKELHDCNRNLGLVCSSSEMSDEGSSIKNVWSETQQQRYVRKGIDNLSDQRNEPNETAKEINTEEEMNFNNTDTELRTSEHRLELSNAIHPVLKLIDKRLLPSKMNITFCADVFPRQSVSNILIPQPCERKKFTEMSQEALYQVKRKLESLHNVLRLYEIQNIEGRTSERPQESNNKINNVRQNVVNTLVSVTTENDNWNEQKKSKVNFNVNGMKKSSETQATVYNSSEQYESDETVRSSVASIQNYSSIFSTCRINNMNESYCSVANRLEPKTCPSIDQESSFIHDNKIVRSSSIKYDKVPERVCYTISSDSDEGKGKGINKDMTATENFTSLPDMYIEENRAKSFSFSDQYHPAPMETDEDLIIMSPTSSRTEISKDSESEDKSTAVLLQEALQFKKALLTRVELQKICYVDDKREDTNSEPVAEYTKYSYINNNLQPKFLDIISEEQSVSSSTEKASHTYMYFNIKQDKQLAHQPMCNSNMLDFMQQNEMRDSNICKGHLDSKHNLGSPSEYFSFSNIIQESEGNNNQLSILKQNHFQQTVSTETILSNAQVKCLNDTSSKSDKKFEEMNFTNCINTASTNINKQESCYNCTHENESFEKHFLRMNNINEFINQNIHSVELFSQNLDETTLDEDQNSHGNVTCNLLSSESLKQYANKNKEDDTLNAKLDVANNEKYIKHNEILTRCSNLTLKRHLGTCSLIDQTLVATNIEKNAEINAMTEHANAIYELSTSESKETSIETNLVQDSLTSSINHSNDSNIPEPPSVTVLNNNSLNEEKLNSNWLNANSNFSDDFVNETNAETFSTNTITLQKYDTVDIKKSSGQETTCNNNTVSVKESEITEIHDQNNRFKNEHKNSIIENSFTSIGKEDLINEADYYKSYSNLISPHSSLYFTDEASSSTMKLNNTYSRNLEDHLHSNLHIQKNNENLCYKDEDSRDTKNAVTIPLLNEDKNMNITTSRNNQKPFVKISNNKFNIKQKLSNFKHMVNNKNDLPSSKNYIESPNMSQINRTKQLSRKENEALNNKLSTMYTDSNNLHSSKNLDVTADKAQPNSSINFTEILNVDQYISSNTSSRQISPREITETKTMKRTNTTIKSRSHENYTSRSEKLKKAATVQNVKSLRSDLLNNVQNKKESNTNLRYTKVRDLSAEPKRTTENSVKLIKKRSRSQINFRTNVSSKQDISQSHESPTNTINYIQSLETKLQLKDNLKPLSLTSKTRSNSCIPILKSRLEAARRSENKARPKSPMRGPLTMTMFWKDNLYSRNHNVLEETRVEGKLKNNNQYMEDINNYAEKLEDSNNHTDKQSTIKSSDIVQNKSENISSNIAQQEQVVIYVNIFTKHDHNTKIVDPNKFLEYIKNRELNTQKIEQNQHNSEDKEFREVTTENEKTAMHKIVTIVSSVINGNELNQTTSTNLSTSKIQNESLANILTNDQLKNLCILSVEQREVDVTAKPSVIDTSTSISDLENISGTSNSVLNKFQICGTPKELNNEEYVTLLEILHQESNFVHLQELQNVCKKLISEHPKSKWH